MKSPQLLLMRVLVLAVVVIALPVAAFAQDRRAAAQDPPSAPVTVVNKAGVNPVPVVGNTTVSGTVTANQGGTWNVGINGTPSVNVANTPLPTTATVSGTVTANQGGTWTVGVSGTPSVNANQSGTWSVAISGTPAVTVANSSSSPAYVKVSNDASNPVPVLLASGAAQQPVQRMTTQTVPPLSTGISLMYTVPAGGKRLVIEYVSVATYCGVMGGQIVAGIRVVRPAGGGTDTLMIEHFIPLTQGPPLGSVTDKNIGGQAVRIYAEPGDKVEAVVFFSGIGAFGLDYTMAFSGHLEPI